MMKLKGWQVAILGTLTICNCSLLGYGIYLVGFASSPEIPSSAVVQIPTVPLPTPTFTPTPILTPTSTSTSEQLQITDISIEVLSTDTITVTATRRPPTPTLTEIIVPPGELYEYAHIYPTTGQLVLVRKLDGTIDPRPDDLEELCKDWLFYRYKITEAAAAGQTDKAAEYRLQFQRINQWLDQYHQDDVNTMFAILEEQGYSWPT